MGQSKYNGRSAYRAMQSLNKLNDELRRFFYWDCEVWKAIKKHIESEEDCAFFDKLDPIMIYRGAGTSISINKFNTYGKQIQQDPANSDRSILVEPDVFNIQFTIEYIDEDERVYSKSYNLNVPIDLLINFTKEAFNKWIEQKFAEKNKGRLELDIKTIKGILSRNPNIMTQLVNVK